jgi:hypothetical protein
VVSYCGSITGLRMKRMMDKTAIVTGSARIIGAGDTAR